MSSDGIGMTDGEPESGEAAEYAQNDAAFVDKGVEILQAASLGADEMLESGFLALDVARDPEEEGEEENGGGAPDEEPLAFPLSSVVESILFAAREPLKPVQIARAVGNRTRQDAVRAAVNELNVHYLESGRAFEIAEISGRFQLMSRPEYVEYIMRIYPKRELADKDKTAKLSQAALDTLAIIAYKQPVTRGEIEHIRGVGCGPVLRALMERGTVKVTGRAQVVGQPWQYGTTEAFLAEFGLGSLDELPLRSEFLSLVGSAPESVEMQEQEIECREVGETGSEDKSGAESEEAFGEGEEAESDPDNQRARENN